MLAEQLLMRTRQRRWGDGDGAKSINGIWFGHAYVALNRLALFRQKFLVFHAQMSICQRLDGCSDLQIVSDIASQRRAGIVRTLG